MWLHQTTRPLMLGLVAVVVICGATEPSFAGPIVVSYTVSGSPGDYELDFSVTNDMQSWPTQNIYFFAVQLNSENITGSPAPFFDNSPVDWNPLSYGGSNTTYNNTWRAPTPPFGPSYLLPGVTLAGFKAKVTDLVAPTEVPWSVLSISPGDLHPYTGGGNFNTQANPGFEGLAEPATLNAAPEPSGLALGSLLSGLCGIGWVRRRLNRIRTTSDRITGGGLTG